MVIEEALDIENRWIRTYIFPVNHIMHCSKNKKGRNVSSRSVTWSQKKCVEGEGGLLVFVCAVVVLCCRVCGK